MTILVTGSNGFIGSNFINHWLDSSGEAIVSLDLVPHPDEETLYSLIDSSRHTFVRGNISDQALVLNLLNKFSIQGVIHFAAETHVDNSILNPEIFINNNILGTFYFLEAIKMYWHTLTRERKSKFRFIQISTDEVYGSLGKRELKFSELSQICPNNPYSASKASADHIARAFYKTYGLPIISVISTNNFGPFQFPEKLIPLTIISAISGKKIPIYGKGDQIRDWIYVKDFCFAICEVLKYGSVGDRYNIGGNNERTNLEVVTEICFNLDRLIPRQDKKSYHCQVNFVKDRLGHDKRYAVNASKIKYELGWKAKEKFSSGLNKTILWYLEHKSWVSKIRLIR
jgi:dTDP-glucose 4,6-dehydratase